MRGVCGKKVISSKHNDRIALFFSLHDLSLGRSQATVLASARTFFCWCFFLLLLNVSKKRKKKKKALTGRADWQYKQMTSGFSNSKLWHSCVCSILFQTLWYSRITFNGVNIFFSIQGLSCYSTKKKPSFCSSIHFLFTTNHSILFFFLSKIGAWYWIMFLSLSIQFLAFF